LRLIAVHTSTMVGWLRLPMQPAKRDWNSKVFGSE
jgi:hypothetical protein